MKTTILTSAAVLALLAAAASPAEAGDWSLRWTGPHGGVYEGRGKCVDGVCESAGTFTGPYGGVWRHAGAAHQAGPGQWAGEGAITGPGGQTWKNSWTWSANGK
ncbi:MAG TPA: hypothetical protein VEH76_12290 [Methylocystis sp.]|nr:hypothetical protein [Methylocystis sp.]